MIYQFQAMQRPHWNYAIDVERRPTFFMHVIIQMKEKCVRNAINLSIGQLAIMATGVGPVMRIVVKTVNDTLLCRHRILTAK